MSPANQNSRNPSPQAARSGAAQSPARMYRWIRSAYLVHAASELSAQLTDPTIEELAGELAASTVRLIAQLRAIVDQSRPVAGQARAA